MGLLRVGIVRCVVVREIPDPFVIQMNEVTGRYRIWNSRRDDGLLGDRQFLTAWGARWKLRRVLKNAEKVLMRSEMKRKIRDGWKDA